MTRTHTYTRINMEPVSVTLVTMQSKLVRLESDNEAKMGRTIENPKIGEHAPKAYKENIIGCRIPVRNT